MRRYASSRSLRFGGRDRALVMKRRRLTHRIFLKSTPRYISVKG